VTLSLAAGGRGRGVRALLSSQSLRSIGVALAALAESLKQRDFVVIAFYPKAFTSG
jgi:hypothetical protein